MTTIDPVPVDAALAQFRDMIGTDGYLLNWSSTGEDRLIVRIEAGPDACADCLVPVPVMEAIIGESLKATPYTLDHVVLPASH